MVVVKYFGGTELGTGGVTACFLLEWAMTFTRDVRELAHGTIPVEVIQPDQNTVFPVDPSHLESEEQSQLTV